MKKNLHACAIAFSALAAFAASARADEPIATDRPDFVESSDTVGKGRLQIETSVAFERNDADGIKVRSRSTPTLVRWGVGEDWELRLETDGFMREQTRDRNTGLSDKATGFSDTAIGIKWHTMDADEKTGRPSMAWLFHADLNTGTREFRGSGLRPSVRATAEWELPGEWSVGVMPGLMFDKRDDGKRFTAGIFAVTVGKGWTDRFRTFVELSGQSLASKKNGGSFVTFDSGAVYLLTNDMQVDFAISKGLNDDTPDFSWTVGFSVRF